MRTPALRSGLLTLVACVWVTACAPGEAVSVGNAWIRTPPPGAAVAAGYFDIVNHGDTPVVLIGARSSAASTIEMHTTEHDGDLLRMRKLERVELPAGATVTFQAGGYHLMLMHFTGVTTGTVPVTLVFADSSELTVPFELRSAAGVTTP